MLDGTAEQNETIRELIDQIFCEEDGTRRSELAAEILALDPENPVARFIEWESLDEEGSMQNLGALEKAYEDLRELAETLPDSDERDGYEVLLVAMLSNLASCEYFDGKQERAFRFAEEFMRRDDEGQIAGRVIYYALLIETGKFEEAIEAADNDFCATPMGAYARTIALFETRGPGLDVSISLLEAILLDPDMAFFVLGLWELDEEGDGNLAEEGGDDDLMMQVAVLTDLWGASEDRLAFLGAIVFAFGYLTGRIEKQEDIAMLEGGYQSLGCLDEMTAAKQCVETMTAQGRDPAEVDEEALALLQEMIEQGAFG